MKRRAETDKLEHLLLRIGKSIQKQIAQRGYMILLVTALSALFALFLVDFLGDIPWYIRIPLTAAALIYGLMWLNANYLRKARIPLSAQEVSLKVEKAYPDLQSRMISTLQFQEMRNLGQGVSENLAEGMVDQAFDQVSGIHMHSIVDSSWKTKQLKNLFFISALFAVSIYLFPNHMLAFAMRFIDFEYSYPTRTHINEVSINDMIPAGDSFTIEVDADGKLPEIGTITITTASNGTVEFTLTKVSSDESVSPATAHYKADIAPINESVEMDIYLGDANFTARTLTPTPRPFLKSIHIDIQSPAYTNLEKHSETSGNIRVIKGSQLSFTFIASKALESLNIQSMTEGMELPTVQSQDNINWTFSLPAKESFSYSLSMKSSDGLESVENAKYQVSVMKDRPPVIRISQPKSTQELASVSKMPLRFKVNDDIGLDSISVKYLISSGGLDSSGDIDYDNALTYDQPMQGNNDKLFTFDKIWDNKKLKLRTGDRITLWIEASDRSPDGHIQRSS
ncbi:MAG: hypothetical protein HRU15_15655, partial [Planctomycetes bacterium]|nr:hypothetical protein [Planctomycetota bacterium]